MLVTPVDHRALDFIRSGYVTLGGPSAMIRFRLICLLTIWFAVISGSTQQQSINNDSILQMTKAGLGDTLIIQSINSTPSNFATSTSHPAHPQLFSKTNAAKPG